VLKSLKTFQVMAMEQIEDSIFMFANRTKSTYFTRKTAKMTFLDAIYFILKGLRRTLQIEIDHWFEFLGGENTMTKQAFSQLRKKIKPDAFMQLNETLKWFYSVMTLKDSKIKIPRKIFQISLACQFREGIICNCS